MGRKDFFGYAFDSAGADGPRLAIRAWPWRFGRTGSAALVAIPGTGVFRHDRALAVHGVGGNAEPCFREVFFVVAHQIL